MSQTSSTTPPEPDPPPVASVPDPPAPLPDPWWSVALVLLVSLGIAVGIVALSASAARSPAPVERRFPLASGTTLSYRITAANGTTSYQSENIERRQGIYALDLLDISTRLLVASRITGIPESDLSIDRYRAFREANAGQVVVARVADTTYDSSGQITPTSSLLLVRPEQAELLAVDGQGFVPPLPLLDATLSAGAPRTITGIYALSRPYTATIVLEANESIETPIGRLDDCQRVRLTLQIAANASDQRSWYCAGIGIARQELHTSGAAGTTRYELIAVSAPALIASAEQPAPLPVLGLGGGAPAQSISGTLETLWSYHESGQNTHITTPVLAVGGPAADAAGAGPALLLYGTANGGLLALDRSDHRLAWRFQTGGAISAAPVAADGLVYVGSTDRKLYALDLHSGAFRWAFATRDAITAAPAVANGLIYVGSEDRTVYALDAHNGQERWRYTTGDSVAATPTVVDGVVYVGSDDGALYALDGATGMVRWAFAAEDAITGAVAVADGVVYVGSNDGTLYALATNTPRSEGELLWSYDAGAAITSDLALGGGLVYLANDDAELRVVDARSGQERWRYPSSRTLYGAPLLAGDQLLINRGYDILALDARNGAERGTTPTGAPPAYPSLRGDGQELFVGHWGGFLRVLGSGGDQPWAGAPRWQAATLENQLAGQLDTLAVPLLPYGDRLIAVSANGVIYGIAPADGGYERLGQTPGIGVALLPPAIAGDILYLGDQYGHVVAFDLRERRERWRVDLGGRSFSPPAIADGRVLLAATSGKTAIAAAFDARSGRQLWRKRFDFALGIGSSALLYHGRFYLVADAVYALDPASGAPAWSANDGIRPFQITALDGAIYAAGFDSAFNPILAAWDTATGRRRLLLPLDLPAVPRLHDAIAGGAGQILLSLNDNTLLALDAASGAERWRMRTASQLAGTPIVLGGAVLVITLDNHLLARALADGRLLGDFALQNTSGNELDSAMAPLVRDERLYAAFGRTAFALTLKLKE